MSHDAKHSVLFPDLLSKPAYVRFDEPDTTTDGGAILLKSVDESIGLTERLAACFEDSRQPAKVVHELGDLLRQRVYGLSCGYSDANDAARVGEDPAHRMLLDRDPIEGEPLASQPTLSRFENAIDVRSFFRLREVLLDQFIASWLT